MSICSGPLVLREISFLGRGPFSLTVNPGEICGLWGDSGVGKSCLLRSVADLDDHLGSAQLGGVNAQSVDPPEWRKQVGYLPAESGWWADRVRDHFVADDPGLMAAAQRLGLEGADLEKEVNMLSTGERQRLAVIRLLLNQPSVLLLDEPTANLDESSMTRVESLILEYVQRESCPVIWVGHDRAQLHRVADRVYQLTTSGVVHGD